MKYSIAVAHVTSRLAELRGKAARVLSSPTKLDQLRNFSASTSSSVEATCSKNMDCSVLSLKPLGDSEVHIYSVKLPSRYSGSSTDRGLNFYADLLSQKLQVKHTNDHHIISKVLNSCTRVSRVGIAASTFTLMMGASVWYSWAANSASWMPKRSPVSTGTLMYRLNEHSPAMECAGLPTEDQEKANAPIYVVNHYHGFSIVELILVLSFVFLLFRRS